MMRLRFLGPLVAVVACQPSFDPASYVQGLRVLAVKAEPPEVAPGQMTMVTALAVDTGGASIDAAWAACTRASQPGYGAINPDCLTHDQAPYLVPLGMGLQRTVLLPLVRPEDFGPPDSSGAFYLPIRVRAQTQNQRLDTIYRARLAGMAPPNQNPKLAAVQVVPPMGGPVLLDEMTPKDVHAGDRIALRATFTDDSAESYQVVVGATQTVTELLRVSWFATAGSFSEPVTSQSKPDTLWRADDHLPTPGTTIDLYVIGRDERGGTDYVHRRLTLR